MTPWLFPHLCLLNHSPTQHIAIWVSSCQTYGLKRLCRPFCIATPAVTSGRRWEHNGVLRTILLMWRLRLSYYLGVEPALLARLYDAPRSPA